MKPSLAVEADSVNVPALNMSRIAVEPGKTTVESPQGFTCRN
ncbi:DUF5983 family protein [Citrobacter braakii]